jgi:cellulose synthase (UDP-forming)
VYAMKPAYQSLHPARQLVVLLFFIVGVWYLDWRLDTFNDLHPIFSRLLYAAEIFGFATALLNAFMTWRLTERTPPAPEQGLKVDVFIPTYNEDVEMVRRTALAARAMDYPHQTWILDDGDRPAMRAMAESLGVRYLARSDNTDAKAGNLNHALPHSDADLIATFDADHAPHRNFLMRTLGYFSDEQVAFVQTPQDFYNLDSFQNRTNSKTQVAWSEQSLFFRVIQRGKDYWNSAFYCGSCALIRRSSLDTIGGFATGTITEDIHTSLKLHKQGYKSVYHAESLAYGVAPDKIEPFLKQRVRWGVGSMNVWRKERIIFTRGLTFAQRVNYLATMFAYFDGWQKAFFYFAPVYVLMASAMPIAIDGRIFLLHFLPYYLLNFIAFEEISRGYGRSILIEQYNMARFASFAWATLGLLRTRKAFGVTGKQLDARTRKARYMLPQFSVVGLNLLAIPVGIYLYYQFGQLPQDGMWVNVFWAGINSWLALLVIAFTFKRAANRRSEYRFAIPLAAKLNAVIGTVDDLSPHGLSFYGKHESVKVGDTMALMLYLPDGVLEADVEVRGLIRGDDRGERYIRSIGCTFRNLPDAARQRIEQFLYGTDTQWRINGYREDNPTPLQRLGMVRHAPVTLERVKYWAACHIAAADGETPAVGLAGSLSGVNRILLISYGVLDQPVYQIEVYTRTGQRRLSARPGAYDTLSCGNGSLHVYQMELVQTDTLRLDDQTERRDLSKRYATAA